MRRRMALFLGNVLAATAVLVVTDPLPASAVAACVGEGTARTNPTFYPPFTGTFALGNAQKAFTQTFVGGLALCPVGSGADFNAVGTFSGWCGLAAGRGVLGDGERFAWVDVGTIRVVTGSVTGVVHVLPDTENGHSCSPDGTGALAFVLKSARTRQHCTSPLFSDFDTLVAGDLFHVWVASPCTTL